MFSESLSKMSLAGSLKCAINLTINLDDPPVTVSLHCSLFLSSFSICMLPLVFFCSFSLSSSKLFPIFLWFYEIASFKCLMCLNEHQVISFPVIFPL